MSDTKAVIGVWEGLEDVQAYFFDTWAEALLFAKSYHGRFHVMGHSVLPADRS